jgi:hypothetical protein
LFHVARVPNRRSSLPAGLLGKTAVSRVITKLDMNNRVQVAMLVHDAGLV